MHIKKKHLQTVLDRDSSWFTPANKVVYILSEIGPRSAHPDEKVIKRIADKSCKGGQDQLLRFLEERLEMHMQSRVQTTSVQLA